MYKPQILKCYWEKVLRIVFYTYKDIGFNILCTFTIFWALSEIFIIFQKMIKKDKIGQKIQKIFFHSLSAPICAGLPKFEEKIQQNKKVMDKLRDKWSAPYRKFDIEKINFDQ